MGWQCHLENCLQYVYCYNVGYRKYSSTQCFIFWPFRQRSFMYTGVAWERIIAGSQNLQRSRNPRWKNRGMGPTKKMLQEVPWDPGMGIAPAMQWVSVLWVGRMQRPLVDHWRYCQAPWAGGSPAPLRASITLPWHVMISHDNWWPQGTHQTYVKQPAPRRRQDLMETWWSLMGWQGVA